ncbi:MAG TPA: dihydrofolate reductase family protein [Pyrinomonadaceae bacterium]|nr:dihydrofolate reductase family protein [Pyrinomonadaceae bacterium]
MRKVILFIANSLDGFIARADGGFDWLFTDNDYGMRKFYGSIDAVMMGRKTYGMMLGFGESSYRGKKNYVFSRKSGSSTDENVEFVSGDVKSFVESLKRQPGKDIWLVGGFGLAETFWREHLIDEIILSVHPIILGSGIPLFRKADEQIDLELLKSKAFKSGLVQLHYRVK